MNVAKRLTLRLIAGLVIVVTLFLLAAWIGSSIPRNRDWVEPADGVTIMIETNGVHTSIIMPVVTPQKDWRVDFPAGDLVDPTRPYTHVSVSWGEREVFLNTPTWSDLTPATSFGALAGGDALLHISHYVRPAPYENARPLVISEQQYARLVTAVEREIIPHPARKSYPGYASYDVFYDAPGTYHLGKTCNQWTSDTLAEAGVETGWWTPMAGGVMKWVPEP